MGALNRVRVEEPNKSTGRRIRGKPWQIWQKYGAHPANPVELRQLVDESGKMRQQTRKGSTFTPHPFNCPHALPCERVVRHGLAQDGTRRAASRDMAEGGARRESMRRVTARRAAIRAHAFSAGRAIGFKGNYKLLWGQVTRGSGADAIGAAGKLCGLPCFAESGGPAALSVSSSLGCAFRKTGRRSPLRCPGQLPDRFVSARAAQGVALVSCACAQKVWCTSPHETFRVLGASAKPPRVGLGSHAGFGPRRQRTSSHDRQASTDKPPPGGAGIIRVSRPLPLVPRSPSPPRPRGFRPQGRGALPRGPGAAQHSAADGQSGLRASLAIRPSARGACLSCVCPPACVSTMHALLADLTCLTRMGLDGICRRTCV